MFDDLFEQEHVLEIFGAAKDWPDTIDLRTEGPIPFARSQLATVLNRLDAMYVPKNSREGELLAELDSLLSLVWTPSDLSKGWDRIKELLLVSVQIKQQMDIDEIAKQKNESDKKAVRLKSLPPTSRRAKLNKMKTRYVKLMRTVLAKNPRGKYLQLDDPRVKDAFKEVSRDTLPTKKTLQNWASQARKKTPKK